MVVKKVIGVWLHVLWVIFTLGRPVVNLLITLMFRITYGKQKPLPPITNPILLLSASQLAERIRKKQITSEEVMRIYMQRVQEINPMINAMVDQRFDAAIQEAKAVDKLVKSGAKTEEQIARETPFLGVPFTCKEAIGVTGMYQTCGLVERKGMRAPNDAEVVRRYRKAGAIPLVSSNIPELCMWWESGNHVYGMANNPYNYYRTPGGSSGGEGCIIGAAGAVMGLGNDVAGSIRIPASFCGIFGHKPTTGVVSNAGMYPEIQGVMNRYVSTGPMCRYAEDLLPLMKLLADDKRLRLDEKVRFQDVTFYYMEDDDTYMTSAVPGIRNAIKKAAFHFKEKFGAKVERANLEELKHAVSIWESKLFEVNPPPFTVEMADYKGQVNATLELFKWIFRCSNHTLPAIFFGIFEKRTKDKEYFNALALFKKLEKTINEMLAGKAVFFYPTHPEPPPHHHTTIPKMPNIGYTAIFNILGFPASQIPAGLCEGLPIGIQAISARYNDHLTLAAALELDSVFKGWISPGPINLK